MKLQGFLAEEDFNHGDKVFVVDGNDFKEVTVITVKPDEILVCDWEDPNGPLWEKAGNCFKKESPILLS